MADGTDENVYVVAPGVTIYGKNNEYHEGEVITPADVGSLTNFRMLVAMGKIILSEGDGGGDEPGDGGDWNYTSIDDKLDANSPNPVENRVLTKAFNALDKKDAAMAQQIAALQEAQAEPIPQEDIRTMWNDEEANNGEEVS